MQDTTIPTETRERITQAADRLHQEHGKTPTVDQVRRAAKADMNTTSAVMREWRRSLSAPAPVASMQVPEALAQAHSNALASLWATAQELANDTLRSAQAGWEAERLEMEQMRAEVAEAAEQIEREAQTQMETAERKLKDGYMREAEQATRILNLENESQSKSEVLQELAERCTRAEAKAEHQEEMIRELRETIGRLQDTLATERAEFQRMARERAEALESAQALRVELEGKLPEAQRSIEHQKAALHSAEYEVRELRERLDEERKQRMTQAEHASTARERAAELKGRVEALEGQNRELLNRLPKAQQPREKKPQA